MGKLVLPWNPADPQDPGPCIRILVTNSADVLSAGRAAGLEFPKSVAITALIDTGASVTVISKIFANHCKLFQTSAGTEITALGSVLRCGEHAGSIAFPGTDLRGFESMRIISADFVRQRHYSCLIGRDILRHWNMNFDGRRNRITIED